MISDILSGGQVHWPNLHECSPIVPTAFSNSGYITGCHVARALPIDGLAERQVLPTAHQDFVPLKADEPLVVKKEALQVGAVCEMCTKAIYLPPAKLERVWSTMGNSERHFAAS